MQDDGQKAHVVPVKGFRKIEADVTPAMEGVDPVPVLPAVAHGFRLQASDVRWLH
jgi:hypothetical protein